MAKRTKKPAATPSAEERDAELKKQARLTEHDGRGLIIHRNDGTVERVGAGGRLEKVES